MSKYAEQTINTKYTFRHHFTYLSFYNRTYMARLSQTMLENIENERSPPYCCVEVSRFLYNPRSKTNLFARLIGG